MAFSIRWYLALVAEGEVFDADEHARSDMGVFGFTYEQTEGQFASLRVVTQNPLGAGGTFALGLLGATRKQWCLFSASVDDGPAQLILRGRIVAVPTDVFGPKVTVDFQARPVDFTAQKHAIADAIKAAGPPVWCPEFYDEQRREDVELVLESMSAIWYIDPVTHVVSLSDILLGEGDALSFGLSEHRFDGMKMSLAETPIPAVDVDVELSWTQRAVGTVEMALSSSSYTIDADAYPKAGASFGDGWTVQTASVTQTYSFEVRPISYDNSITIKWWDGNQTSLHTQGSDDTVVGMGIGLPSIQTNINQSSSYSKATAVTPARLTSWSFSEEHTNGLVPLYDVSGTFVVAYDAARPMVERVTYTLRADVQATVVPPDDADAPRLEFKSVDLSELIEAEAPIGDPRRRSYVAQPRGEDSLFYTLLCGTAKLRRAARAVTIEFSPFLNRLLDLRLDKNAVVHDWRLPSGEATGKITRFTLTYTPPTDKSGASHQLVVMMGCAVGRDGALEEVLGEPDYVEDEYVEEDDRYQERTGEVILFDDEVGFTPPPFAPADDGVDFLSSGLTPLQRGAAMIEVPVAYSTTAADQAAAVGITNVSIITGMSLILPLPPPGGFDDWPSAMQDAVQKRADAVKKSLEATNMRVTFKMKNMRAKFETPIALVVQDPKIPRMIDLEFEEES